MIVATLGAYKILNLKIKEKGSYEMYLKEYEKLDGVTEQKITFLQTGSAQGS